MTHICQELRLRNVCSFSRLNCGFKSLRLYCEHLPLSLAFRFGLLHRLGDMPSVPVHAGHHQNDETSKYPPVIFERRRDRSLIVKALFLDSENILAHMLDGGVDLGKFAVHNGHARGGLFRLPGREGLKQPPAVLDHLICKVTDCGEVGGKVGNFCAPGTFMKQIAQRVKFHFKSKMGGTQPGCLRCWIARLEDIVTRRVDEGSQMRQLAELAEANGPFVVLLHRSREDLHNSKGKADTCNHRNQLECGQ